MANRFAIRGPCGVSIHSSFRPRRPASGSARSPMDTFRRQGATLATASNTSTIGTGDPFATPRNSPVWLHSVKRCPAFATESRLTCDCRECPAKRYWRQLYGFWTRRQSAWVMTSTGGRTIRSDHPARSTGYPRRPERTLRVSWKSAEMALPATARSAGCARAEAMPEDSWPRAIPVH